MIQNNKNIYWSVYETVSVCVKWYETLCTYTENCYTHTKHVSLAFLNTMT